MGEDASLRSPNCHPERQRRVWERRQHGSQARSSIPTPDASPKAQHENYDWAASASHQAAEKAIKALFQKLHLDAWGHTLSLLLANLPEDVRPDAQLIDVAKELDKHYIPTRYPNGFERGAPVDFHTLKEAEAAIANAERLSERRCFRLRPQRRGP